MKTGRLIYNVAYCIGLMLQVKDKKMSLEDVMSILEKDYHAWYTTYWAPIEDINKKAKDAQLLAIYGRYEESIAKQKQFIAEAEKYAKLYKERELAYISANDIYMSYRGRYGGTQKAINDIMRHQAAGQVQIDTGYYRRMNEYGDYEYYAIRKWVNQETLSAEEYENILEDAVIEFNDLLENRQDALDLAKKNFEAAVIARNEAYDALNISKGKNEQAALAAKDADNYINQYNKLKKEAIEYQLIRLFLSF